jgi:glycosyltransferase involved in cell wall biosynthesis
MTGGSEENQGQSMSAIAEKEESLGQNISFSRTLRIALCFPESAWVHEVMNGEYTDAAHIQQGYIAAGLQARGHVLTFVAPRNLQETVWSRNQQQPHLVPRTWSSNRWFEIASKGVWRIQRQLGMPYLNIFSNLRRFDACMRCLPGHDLVYERNGLYNAGVAMACRRLKLPYVLFFDADQIAEQDYMGRPITGLLRWCAKKLLRYNLRAANTIICVSEPTRVRLMTAWNVPGEKIVVFPNGVDVQRFRPDPKARRAVRTALGMGSRPLLIFVGNFYDWHDLSTLLDALSHVLRTNPDARLVLVGDGPQREGILKRASDLGIAHAVHFTGAVAHTDVPRLLSAVDIAVAPVPAMKGDSWLSPMKLFEYMASGAAVVASKAGQIIEVIQDGSNGLLVPSGDALAMSAALKRLLDDPTLRSRLGLQARQDAVRKHSWDHYLTRLERVYGAVIAGQPVNLL